MLRTGQAPVSGWLERVNCNCTLLRCGRRPSVHWQPWIRRGAHRALAVRATERSSRVAEKRAMAGAAVSQRRCGKLKLCRGSQSAGAHNDVAKRIAIFHARGEFGLQEA